MKRRAFCLAAMMVGLPGLASADDALPLPRSALHALAPDIAMSKKPSFVQRMLIAHARPAAPGTGAPIDILPRAVFVPLPHLRPGDLDEASVTGVDDIETAAIAPDVGAPSGPPSIPALAAESLAAGKAGLALAPRDVAPVAAPPAVVAVAAPVSVKLPVAAPAAVADAEPSDSLLGDPTAYFDRLPKGPTPQIAQPAAIDAALPGAGADAATVPDPVPATPDAPPFELVRALQSLQDRTAQGSTEALTAERLLRGQIDRVFAGADGAVWQDARNAQAAVTYVLSGGSPEILKRLAGLNPPPDVDAKLVAGVLAYAFGKEDEAAADLAGLDPASLPASMGAELALAQSALAVRTDPQRSLQLLGMARLLAPGTLVEEAALRRGIFVADQLKQVDQVDSLARQYLDRFRHSLYAGNFRLRFAAAVSHMDFTSPDQFAAVKDIVSSVEPEARGELYLTLAVVALGKGNTAPAGEAAGLATTLVADNAADESRARLYHAAAILADANQTDAAVAELKTVDATLLSSSDLALRDAVTATVAGVQAGTTVPPGAVQVADLDQSEQTPLMARASDALKAADAALTGVTP